MLDKRLRIPLICIVAWISGAILWNVTGVVLIAKTGRKRVRLARFLSGHVDRVQKSVFEGQVVERRLEGLRGGIQRIIDQAEDSVRLYTLCPRCQGATEVMGTGIYVGEEEGDVLV